MKFKVGDRVAFRDTTSGTTINREGKITRIYSRGVEEDDDIYYQIRVEWCYKPIAAGRSIHGAE